MRALLVALLALAAGPVVAATLPAPLAEPLLPPVVASGITVRLTPLATFPADSPGAGAPVARIQYLVPDPGNAARQFVNDTTGTLYSLVGGTPTPYLNLAAQNVGFTTAFDPTTQSSFLGVAFNPNFDGDPAKPGYGKFYTTYSAANSGTATAGTYGGQPVTFNAGAASNHVIVLREWTATDPTAGTFSGTSRVVFTSGAADAGHNDGTIAFNPTAAPGSADFGKLYVGLGVSGFNDPALNGGNLAVSAGKILRIDPLAGTGGAAYAVPATNPFVGVAGALPEIYAYGLRYPQSFGWDAKTGAMYINDIGQAGAEEVDLGMPGANYGWPYRQGTFGTVYDYGLYDPNDQNVYPVNAADGRTGLTDPIAEYDHSAGAAAIGSGVLYRGSLIPALDGMYVFGDIVTGALDYFDPATAAPGHLPTIYSLGVSDGSGPIDLVAKYGADYLFGPRADLRLSETSGGELEVALKADGMVFALSAPPVAVPEPGPWLWLPALGALAFARRRRPRSGLLQFAPDRN